eukprot:1392365-Amorphochlora_amoeboformis.AAC.1
MVSLLRTLLILEAAYLVLGGGSGTESDPCTPTFGTTFVFKFDPFAAATGYYTVDGCGGGTLTQPVLLMQAGVEYTFDQVQFHSREPVSPIALLTSLLLIFTAHADTRTRTHTRMCLSLDDTT